MKNVKEFGNIRNYKVKYLNDIVEIEDSDFKCNHIIVDNIKIENIGTEVLKNLYFIRDEKQSSKDFIICQNENVHELILCEDEFRPGKTETHSISLKINNPKLKQKYTLYLYVRQNINGVNLSKPLKIIYTVKNIYQELNPVLVQKIAQELNDEFNIFSIKDREEVFNKIIELRCNRDNIINWLEESM